jgi:carboxynorspermidine decarboxylase
MPFQAQDFPRLETPAFVYDERKIIHQIEHFSECCKTSGLKLLYSVKALPLAETLALMAPLVDGYSASSPFEARLAAEAGQGYPFKTHTLHITSPGLRLQDLGDIARHCDQISFNSLEQCRRLLPALEGPASLGIRVNPRLSFLDDPRYDPCRPFSKLGVPVEELRAALTEDPALAARIEGLHFHTSFESRSFQPLRATLAHLEQALGPVLAGIRWINLGGGYLVASAADARALSGIVLDLKRRWPVEVYVEPGKAVVGPCGWLVASVIDRFTRDGKPIAVLDTGVHHLPEAFEYQKSPALADHRPDGAYPCLLAGCTCLAGDVFGEYRFERPLEVGDRVAFANVGAYALVKASRFNGHDWPSIYALGLDGQPRLVKRYGYENYRAQWTADGPMLAANRAGL